MIVISILCRGPAPPYGVMGFGVSSGFSGPLGNAEVDPDFGQLSLIL